jgi:hypothetical protein
MTPTRSCLLSQCLALLCITVPALADPVVTFDPTDAGSSTPSEFSTDRWEIEISVTRTDGPTNVLIEMPDGESIREVEVTLPDADWDTTLILQGDGGPTDPIDLVQRIAYVYTPGSDEEARLVIGFLRADLVDPFNTAPAINAHEITDARIGDLEGGIELLQSKDSMGAYTVDAVLRELFVFNDYVGRNQANPTSRFPVTVVGPLEFMSVGGDCGTAALPIAIRAARIQELEVGGDFNGQINTQPTASTDNGFVQSVRVEGSMNGTGFAGATGRQNDVIWADQIGGLSSGDTGIEVLVDLAGDITIEDNVDRRIRVLGDFDGVMTVTDSLDDDPNGPEIEVLGDLDGSIEIMNGIDDPSIEIVIGASLLGDITVGGELAADVTIGDMLVGDIVVDQFEGLTGQIIVNGNNTAPVSNYNESWFGDVVVDTITLGPTTAQPGTAPRYGTVSDDLGGGAVGLSRFDFHDLESDPVRGAKLSSAPSMVVLEYYGPITEVDNDSNQAPVIIETAPALTVLPVGCSSPCDAGCGTLMEWGSDLSSQYSVGVSGRVVTVTGTFSPGNRYRVRSREGTDDRLVCVGVVGQPTVRIHAPNPVAGCTDNNYIFAVLPVLSADLSGNGSVGEEGIASWTAAPTDVDASDLVELQDLVAVIDAMAE